MEDSPPPAFPARSIRSTLVRRWLLLLVILAPGVFVAAACGATVVLERSHASSAVQISILILFGTILALVVTGTIVRHVDHWRMPLRALIAQPGGHQQPWRSDRRPAGRWRGGQAAGGDGA